MISQRRFDVRPLGGSFETENVDELDTDVDDKKEQRVRFLMPYLNILMLIVFFFFTASLIYSSRSSATVSPYEAILDNNGNGKKPVVENEISMTTMIVPPKSIYPKSKHTVIWAGCLKPPYPTNMRHMVQPPAGPVDIVCCNTTKGVLNIEVHPSWAPLGAQRFMNMVEDGFFSTNVALFRALKGFLVQFGLAGDPAVQRKYNSMGTLKDDPSWLPLGPSGRELNGIKRFQRGYLAYAGGGNNSRGTQLIMAFQDNAFLAGGSPWEVPFGQLIGDESFSTLSQIYTGYGESPEQGKIQNKGNDYLKKEFPLLDYISQCVVLDKHIAWHYSTPQTTS
jgi:peptidyl-prolyl cis-trans isomerase A (cyclophilin A)